MAFLGIAIMGVAFICIMLGIFFFGLVLIIAGTIMQKKNFHRKLATAMKIFGYFIVVPIIFVIALFIGARFM